MAHRRTSSDVAAWHAAVAVILLCCAVQAQSQELALSSSACSGVSECEPCLANHRCGWCVVPDGDDDTHKVGFCTDGDLLGAFNLCNGTVHPQYYYGTCTQLIEENPNIRAVVSAVFLLCALFITLYGYRYIIGTICAVSFAATFVLCYIVLTKIYFFADLTFSMLLSRLPPLVLALLSLGCTYLSYAGKLHPVFFKAAVFELGLVCGVLLTANLLSFRIGSHSAASMLSDIIDMPFVVFAIVWVVAIAAGSFFGVHCVRGSRKVFIVCTSYVGAMFFVMSTSSLNEVIVDDSYFSVLGIDMQRTMLTHVRGIDTDRGSWEVGSYAMFITVYVCTFASYTMQNRVTAKHGLRHLTLREARLHAMEEVVDDHDLQHLRRTDPVTGNLVEMSAQDMEDAMTFDDSDEADTMQVIRSARQRLHAEADAPAHLRALAAVGLYHIESAPVPAAKVRRRRSRRCSKPPSSSSSSTSSDSSSQATNQRNLELLHPGIQYPLCSRVEVGYEEGSTLQWYPASVTGYSCEDKTYTVKYETGEVSYGVQEEHMRLPQS